MPNRPRRIAVLGSTGSLGEAVLSVARAFPDRLSVAGLVAGTNVSVLIDQVREFRPFMASFARTRWPAEAEEFQDVRQVTEVEMATHPEVDVVVVATSGRVGLEPTVAALQAGKTVALGNTETLAMAGPLLRDTADRHHGRIVSLDPETVGLWQVLRDEPEPPHHIIIPASWGPSRAQRTPPASVLTPDEVASPPSRRLGRKRVIDAMTLMTKAVQAMEAHYMFDVPLEGISVVYHPENVMRAMAEFRDGVAKAVFAPSDPRLAAQTVLLGGERHAGGETFNLNLSTLGRLTFEPLDMEKYPVLQLALEAAKAGGTYPAALSAANSAAVELFLAQQASIRDIPNLLKAVMRAHQPVSHPTLEDIIEADRWAHDFVGRQVPY